MNSRTNANYRLIFDLIPISILGDKVFGVDLGLVVEVSNDRNYIGYIQHFDIVFIGRDHYADVAFGCFDQVIFFQTQQVFTPDCFSQIDLKVIFVYFDGVFVVSPDLCECALHS